MFVFCFFVRKNPSSSTFFSSFRRIRQVVGTADVVLEVLDARDPLGSRAEAVEEAVLSKPGKKLVLVLNKVRKKGRVNLFVVQCLEKNLNASKPSEHVRRFRWEHWL